MLGWPDSLATMTVLFFVVVSIIAWFPDAEFRNFKVPIPPGLQSLLQWADPLVYLFLPCFSFRCGVNGILQRPSPPRRGALPKNLSRKRQNCCDLPGP